MKESENWLMWQCVAISKHNPHRNNITLFLPEVVVFILGSA